MTLRRLDPGEIRGHCCPACGNAAGIRRERRTEPYNTGHLLAAASFGILGLLAVRSGRTRIRLRCTTCNCQFPEPAGILPASIACIALNATAVIIIHVYVRDQSITFLAAASATFLTLLFMTSQIQSHRRSMARWRTRYAADLQRASAAAERQAMNPVSPS